MGLDQFVYTVDPSVVGETEIDLVDDNDGAQNISQLRNVWPLHRWIHRLYIQKGGVEDFNCSVIRFMPEDISSLQNDMREGHPLYQELMEVYSDVQFSKGVIAKIQQCIADVQKAMRDGKVCLYQGWF